MLMAFWEVQRLTREIHQLERQAIEKRTKLMKYQKYTDRLASSGVMTGANVAGIPQELIMRANVFAQFSNYASSMQAAQQVQQQQMMGMYSWAPNMLAQQQMITGAFARFKEESLKALKQQEADVISEVEKEIQLEMNTIDKIIKEKKAMLESCKKLLDEEVRDSAPKFGLG